MKKFITLLSLTAFGVGALVYTMKRKRRRLLEEENKVYNKVSEDFGKNIPNPLYRYLRSLGDNEKVKENFELWGYQKVLEFSKSVLQSLEDDMIIILGKEKSLSSELGKHVFLMYSKKGYPDSLILVSHEENDGQLTYHSSLDFSIIS